MRIWAFVPARGGSKSIRMKNLVPLGGRPLIDYVLLAASAWQGCERIVCSTDHSEIAERCRALAIETDERPEALAGDEVAVADVARDFVTRSCRTDEAQPDWLLLLQPTSPFVLPQHLEELAAAVRSDPHANSAQNIVSVPHNHHAWNQRVVSDGEVSFAYAQERARAYNKQLKPRHYIFGNLVAVRTRALLAGGDFFATPSRGVEIERPYDFDVDGPEDLKQAEALLSAGCVHLPHLAK
jgi:CMP-N,N'-diacetyllegionaminic acid synthase